MRTPSGSRPSPWRTPEIRLSPTKSPTNKPSLTLAVPLGKSQECKAYWIFTSLFPLCSWQCTILHKRINRAGLIMTFKPQHQITPYCHIAIIFDIGSRNKDTDYLFLPLVEVLQAMPPIGLVLTSKAESATSAHSTPSYLWDILCSNLSLWSQLL